MTALRFRDEFRLCLRFIWRPSLTRQVPRTTPVNGWIADWWLAGSFGRLFAWAAALWLINIVILGPIILAVYDQSGATHRININNLPWFQALLWAPIVEELIFRFGLRRPGLGLLVTPVLLYVFLNGFAWWASSLVVLVVLMVCVSMRHSTVPRGAAWQWLRTYRRGFPLVMHTSVVAFAALHLHNYDVLQMPLWMMAVLVLPQWVTGLALCWVRVQRGIGAAMVLHALFNAGPLCLTWLALQLS